MKHRSKLTGDLCLNSPFPMMGGDEGVKYPIPWLLLAYFTDKHTVLMKKIVENKTPGFSKAWLCLALIILFVVFVRVRLLEFPLDRDEGEYAYTAQLMLQGIAP